MSAEVQLEPALAFLTSAPRVHPRQARWSAESVGLWFRFAQFVGVFATAVGVTAAVSAALGPIGVQAGLLSAVLATIAGALTARAWRKSDGVASRIAAAFVSALIGGGTLASAGLDAKAALLWFVLDAGLATLLLTALRAGCAEVLACLLDQGRLAQHVAIVGTGPVARRIGAQLEISDPLAVQVAGRYALLPPPGDSALRGDLRTLLCDARLDKIDAIVIALEPDEADDLATLRHSLRACVQDVFLAPDFVIAATDDAKAALLGGLDVLVLTTRPIKGGSAVAKRVFDLGVACALLALMAPLLLLLAATIRIETRGPILFRQLRVGYNNRLFYIFKFRSMFQEASDRLAKQQTVLGDKRVTRVGRIIRKLSLDELPQLLNVVRGEMSLVGPRPHAPGTSIGGQRVHTLVDNYDCRHLVRPGITGLAQVRGFRGGLQHRRQVLDRIGSDLEYIERWSFWLDIRILLGTVLLELRDSRGS